jgi:hypothetical protein
MTSTNTNPGLVNVADQEIAPVTGTPLATTFPTPAEVTVGEQAPGSLPVGAFITPPPEPKLLPASGYAQ